MQYQLISLNDHLDFGFGITSEAYYRSAKYLDDNKDSIRVFQVAEMPINFLYRHSIELALKSLIIIFHNKLKIKYDNESHLSQKPKIFVNGQWRPLYKCHWIDELYKYWIENLLVPNKNILNTLAKDGDWNEYEDITKAIPIITKYDQESSYFRYPVTENADYDLKKFTMQPIDIEELFNILHNRNKDKAENGSKPKSNIIMALKNDSDEIIKAYRKQNDLLVDLSESLRKVSYYFYCTHIMCRVTLCDCM